MQLHSYFIFINHLVGHHLFSATTSSVTDQNSEIRVLFLVLRVEGKDLSCRKIIVSLEVTTLTALCKWSLAKYCGVQPDQTRGLFSSVQH